MQIQHIQNLKIFGKNECLNIKNFCFISFTAISSLCINFNSIKLLDKTICILQFYPINNYLYYQQI